MAKYINAEWLKDSMFAYYDCLNESAKGRPYKGDTLMDYEVVDMIEDCIENAPTADVVEVVRCKDCKHYKPYAKPVEDFDGECIVRERETDENEFCSYGEPRNKNYNELSANDNTFYNE